MSRNALVITAAAGFAIGFGLSTLMHMEEPTTGVTQAERKPLYWQAPMEPDFRSNMPGKSPMGMDLVPVYADDVGGADEGVVQISPKVAMNLGLKTAVASRGQLSRAIQTVGFVQFDEDRLQHIHTRVSGWVEKLYVKSAGDPVTRGQPLFEIYSPELINAQEELFIALRGGNRELIRGSHDRLIALGLTRAQVDGLAKERDVRWTVAVQSDQDGVAGALNIREGMFVQPTVEVMTIGPLDPMWVIAEVFERQSDWVAAGQPVEMQLDFSPGRVWTGEVDYVYPILDEETRTLRVRVRFPNEDRALRPGMFASLKILAKSAEDVLSIPREAAIRGGVHDRVVISRDGGYQSVPVVLGGEFGERVEVVRGLSAGEVVVTSAQFLIDSESSLGPALTRLGADLDEQDAMPEQSTVWATGELLAHEMGSGTLRIRHDPIPEWEWPSMTMDFALADGVHVHLATPSPIRFGLRKDGQDNYVVTAVERIGETLEEPAPARDSAMAEHQH